MKTYRTECLSIFRTNTGIDHYRTQVFCHTVSIWDVLERSCFGLCCYISFFFTICYPCRESCGLVFKDFEIDSFDYGDILN